MYASRKKLMKQIVMENNIATAGDLQGYLKGLFIDALQEMLETELDVKLGVKMDIRLRTLKSNTES